jgi:hypothetical protein
MNTVEIGRSFMVYLTKLPVVQTTQRRMTGRYKIKNWKDMEEISRGLMQDTIPEFT